MSYDATRFVYEHSSLVGAHFAVHAAIADTVNAENDYDLWMSTAKLAEKARVARSTVTTALAELVECGYLVVMESGGKSRRPTRYHFLFSTGPVFTSAPIGLTSAIDDLTSAIEDDSLARLARTNLNLELEEEQIQLARSPVMYAMTENKGRPTEILRAVRDAREGLQP